MTSVPPEAPVGVVGAGTMGAGVAEVAARAGHPTLLLDVDPSAARAALQALHRRLDRDVEKGRTSADEAVRVADRVTVAGGVRDLAPCALVVEAVAERLDVKQQLFRDLEAVVAGDAVLATNTSSLSVTAIAGALERPGRVVGMHFFNPVPRMRLVEVVRGDRTTPEVVTVTTDLARAWGKTPVTCSSTPGFIVNRVARPFYGEAQRLVEEGVADPATVDLVLRECGGFPMGPFELTDLVGQDVNLAVSRSVWEQTFGDPRYAPTVLQQRLVDAGRLGRKTGRGVYDYAEGGDGARPPVAAEPARQAPERVRLWAGYDFGPMKAFWDRVTAVVPVDLVDDEDDDRAGVLLPGGGVLRVAAGSRASAYTWSAPGGVVLLDWAHDPSTCTRVALSASAGCSAEVLHAAVGLCQAAGVAVTVLRDAPGCVVARTVSMLVNEAVELVGRGEASAQDVDVAMLLGTGYPSGPLQWGDRLGPLAVREVVEDLQDWVPTGRYRASTHLTDVDARGGRLRDL